MKKSKSILNLNEFKMDSKRISCVKAGRVKTDILGENSDWYRDGLLFDTVYVSGVKVTVWGPGNSIP